MKTDDILSDSLESIKSGPFSGIRIAPSQTAQVSGPRNLSDIESYPVSQTVL